MLTKNLFAARTVYNYIKDAKAIGVIREDTEKKMLEVAIPVGVVAGLVPSTNPTSTTIFKALISVKAGNALAFLYSEPGSLEFQRRYESGCVTSVERGWNLSYRPHIV